MKKIQIRGLSFDNVTMEKALSLAAQALEQNKQISVFTPNAEIAQLAQVPSMNKAAAEKVYACFHLRKS